jgi:hypothetical protein
MLATYCFEGLGTRDVHVSPGRLYNATGTEWPSGAGPAA